MLLYFLAEFVLPALTRKEKRMLLPGILIGFALFGFGVVVSYRYILPKTVQWFFRYTYESLGIDIQLRAVTYFSFVAHLTIVCGLLCEVPIVVVALALLDMVSYKLLSGTRPYAVVGIMILVAIISPSPDPVTFLTLALPVLGVYEICIWLVWLIEKRRKRLDTSGQNYPD
jgi:sec-independent protein translocase protein TatC